MLGVETYEGRVELAEKNRCGSFFFQAIQQGAFWHQNEMAFACERWDILFEMRLESQQ